jgi:hypothetical protein
MLSFVRPPAPTKKRLIGNDQVGVLEVEERGGLTVGESATISELLADEQSSFVRGAQIADQIATEEQITLSEAFSIVEKAISGQVLEEKAEAIRLKHAERISEVARVYALAGQRNLEATVTAIIRSRCGAPEWSMDDTRNLAKPLFDGIWELAQAESKAEDMPSEAPSAEELGKQRRGRGRSPAPTGQP